MARVMARPEVSPIAVLRQRNFRLYWIGQFISLTGTWMQAMALSILIQRLNNTAFALGLVNFSSALPPALLLLYSGAVADRHDKRKILIVTQFCFMAVALTLAFLVRVNAVAYWHVLAMAASLGVAQAFDLPANQALVPELVDRHEIPAAVQLNQAIFHGSRVIGPPIAGIMVAAFSLYVAFVANALSMIPVIGTLMVIRSIRPPEHRPKGEMLELIREGYAYVRGKPQLMALLGITAANTVLVFPNLAVLTVYYVKVVLGGADNLLGILMGFSGAGALIGALGLLLVPAGRRVAHIGVGLSGTVVSMIAMAAAPFMPGVVAGIPVVLATACFAAALLGASTSTAMGMVATILQQQAPDELRGRVMSLQNLMLLGLMPFSSLLMTSIVDVITMPVELVVTAVLFGIIGGILFRRLVRFSHGVATS